MELCSFTPYVPLCLKKTSRNVDFNQCDFPKLHFLGWRFQSTVISRGEMRKSACHGWRVPKNATNGDTISITKNEISSFYIDAIHNTDCIVLHSKMTHIVQDILEWFFSHAWEVPLLTKYTCKLSCQLINRFSFSQMHQREIRETFGLMIRRALFEILKSALARSTILAQSGAGCPKPSSSALLYGENWTSTLYVVATCITI